MITASGNIGTSGIFLTASPATGRNVIATGSIMNNHVPGYTLKLFGGGNATQNNDNPTEIRKSQKYINIEFYVIVLIALT